MFRKCAARVHQRLPTSAQCAPETRLTFLRLSSSISEQSRKLPGRSSLSRLKPWQRAFLIGIGTGLVAGQIYLFYQHRYASSSFVTCTLVARQSVSDTASILYLEPRISSNEFQKYRRAWDSGIWSVQIKQPQIQIVRAYTPLPPSDGVEENAKPELRFLVRHDPHGEVSSYLQRIPVGSSIELRGPTIEYQVTPDTQQVVFFAGGTGVAPALQVAYAMFNGSDGMKGQSESATRNIKNRKLHILWANRRREDCLGGVSDAPAIDPLATKGTWPGLFTTKQYQPAPNVGDEKGLIVQELEDLKRKYPGQITVEYFVNAEDTWINEDVVLRSLSRFDDRDFSTSPSTSRDRRQILISGPSGFINYLAGPKEWKNGTEEQGHVSRIVAHAIAQAPHHVKVWKI